MGKIQKDGPKKGPIRTNRDTFGSRSISRTRCVRGPGFAVNISKLGFRAHLKLAIFWYIRGISQGFLRDFSVQSGNLPQTGSDFSGISQGFLRDFSGISQGFLRDFSGISQNFHKREIWDFWGISEGFFVLGRKCTSLWGEIIVRNQNLTTSRTTSELRNLQRNKTRENTKRTKCEK